MERNATKELEELVLKDSQILGRPLTPQEIESLKKQIDFSIRHKGHENEHALAGLFVIFVLIASHIAINRWKNKSPSSYHLATLLGLWWIPFLLALNAGNYRFVIIHLVFSFLNSIIIKMAWQVPLKPSTPKWVYAWYSWVYKISVSIGAIGNFLILIAIFDIPAIITGASIQTEARIFETGLLIVFYGLYFGTLGRDFVDRLSSHMATSVGYYSATGFPKRSMSNDDCAICGESTFDTEKTVLDCSHSFHPICIKGWTVIGKKDMCPCCKEKVDLNAFKKNPWDTAQIWYLSFLDTLRYLLVWNPVVLFILHWFFIFIGLN